MLKSELILFALNDMDDSDLESARVRLGYKIGGTTGHIVKKRIITFALAAALILGLGTVGYAIGVSIHKQRQEELRQELQIDENHVTDYVEFDVPEDRATEGGLTLLSTINDGDYQRFFFNLSPVSEEWITWMDLGTEDGRVYWPYLYVDGEYHGILVNLAGPYCEDYDRESETLGLWASLPNLMLRDKAGAEVCVVIGYTDNETKIHPLASYGPAWIPVTEQRMRSIRFPKPVPFTNPEMGGQGQFIGVNISAEGVTWLVTHDDIESIYSAAREGDDRWISWANSRNDLEWNASIRFSDGSSRTGLSPQRSEYHDCVVYDVYLFDRGTIDIDQVVSVTIGGKTFAIG